MSLSLLFDQLPPALALAWTGIASSESFGQPTLSPGPATLAFTGISSSESFGQLTVSAMAALSLTGISSSESFGQLTVSAGLANLGFTGIASAETFGVASLALGRVVTFPNGQSLLSGALTPAALSALLQTLTCQMLGLNPTSNTDPAYAKVRLGWPTQGQPAWAITDDVCFLRVTEEDDPYNQIRDRKFLALSPTSFQTIDTYTRAWRVNWACYGPTGFDNARLLKSALLGWDFAHDSLAGANLYLVPALPATTRAPELFQGQWWERADFSARLYELVTETVNVDSISTAEVLLYNATGLMADLTNL